MQVCAPSDFQKDGLRATTDNSDDTTTTTTTTTTLTITSANTTSSATTLPDMNLRAITDNSGDWPRDTGALICCSWSGDGPGTWQQQKWRGERKGGRIIRRQGGRRGREKTEGAKERHREWERDGENVRYKPS